MFQTKINWNMLFLLKYEFMFYDVNIKNLAMSLFSSIL